MNLLLPVLVVAATALPAAALAQAQNKLGEHVPPPGFDPGRIRPLTERRDLLSWKLLSQVELVRKKDRYVPQFSGNVAALDKQEVKLQGFMYPLQTGDKQTHFLLWSMPQTCAFCMPGGPENTVEVRSKQAVKYTFEPVVLTGKFEVLKEEPTGIFCRLTDAVQSD